jgi:DNA integrity scanning protein DisA with diadenylate cyclase activity
MRNLFQQICVPEREVSPTILQSVLELAVELAREGREGRKIGTLFTVGDEKQVLQYSRPLILDPLYGHPDKMKRIDNADMRETVKELAQLDGAFIVSGDGVLISAARYLEAPADGVVLPLGLGARHMAAAAMSLHTRAVAVVVSTSSIVRVFDEGEIVGEILPELWIIGRASIYIPHPLIEESEEEKITVVSKEREPKAGTTK